MTEELKQTLVTLLENDADFIKNSIADDDEHNARLTRIEKIAKILATDQEIEVKQDQISANIAATETQSDNERERLELESKRLEWEIERALRLDKIEERKLLLEEQRQKLDLKIAEANARTSKIANVATMCLAGTKVLDFVGQMAMPAIQYSYKTKYANGICKLEMKDSMFTTPGRALGTDLLKTTDYKKI